MANRAPNWRPGPAVCRCCFTEGCYKDLSTEYFWMGRKEIYSNMLVDTLNVTIACPSKGPNGNTRLICEVCIGRLRDAAEFKRQVVENERTFLRYLDPDAPLTDMEEDVPVSEAETQVKVEAVKQENEGSDEDFADATDADADYQPAGDTAADDDDDEDDLDNQPLTKLASKIPKKESVDLMDLLDNTKAAEKRKSSSKAKTPASKKTKPKKEAKATSSKPKPEKKKKGRMADTSIWQLTSAERRNAATLIHYTTVRPFTFMGFSFKCFFCSEYHSEPSSLLNHTSSHKPLNITDIFEKHVPKGKRCLQADISNLQCRICTEKFTNLEAIRTHLTLKHNVDWSTASNGMTVYNMETDNGMFSCHMCNEKFHNFPLLNSHMNSHVGKVVCEDCGAGFLYQHLLMKHKEVHLTRKYNCKQCSRIFYKKSQLKYHTDIHHKGKERVVLKKCSHCSETFKEHYSKIVHLREVHGISKNFQCHICSSNFVTRRAFTEHTTRFHTEKYKCDVCSKCFGIESKLKQHMKGHTGERTFVCSICKNAYMHQVSLKKHMRNHSSEFKFVCPDCGSGFHNKSEYTKHQKQWHSDTSKDASKN